MSSISARRWKKNRRRSDASKNGRLRLERLEERVVLSANYITMSISGDWDVATDSFLMPDGDIVITGTKDPGLIEEMAAIRLNSDGVMDTTFGDGGVATARVGKWYNSGQAAATIFENDVFAGFVIAGSGSDSRYFKNNIDFATARFDVDGNLVGDYGSKGMELTDLGAKEALGAVAVDGQGRIYGAGQATFEGSNEFVLVRYTPTGELDTNFGDGGVAERFDMPASFSHATDVALLSDGRVVVAIGDGMALACYTPGGILDTSFGEGGIVDLDLMVDLDLAEAGYPGAVSSRQAARALVIDSSNNIIVAGDARIELDDGVGGTTWRGVFAVTRFSPAGVLDTDFGQGGIAVADFFEDTGSDASDVVFDALGSIVVVGHVHHEYFNEQHFAAARFDADGLIDPSFGNGGTVVTPILKASRASTLSIQDDGKILVAGYADTGLADPVPRRVYTVIRYLDDGTVDPAFGDPSNDPPETNVDGNPDTATTDEDTPVTVAVLANDDDDGDTLAGILVKDPANGSVTTSEAGALFTYTPDAGYNGTDTFQYVAWDGLRASEITTVTITVGTGNQPIAVADSAFTDVGMEVAINVLENDIDPNDDPLDVISVTQGTQGVVVLNGDDTVTYLPSVGYTGLDSFQYTITDGMSNATAEVTVDIRSDWLPNDQQSWWTADGHARDVMGLNDGTLVGGASYGAGKLGEAFLFDGIDGYVDVGGSSSMNGSRTITAWVNPNENTGYGLPIMTGGVGGQGDFFGIAGTTGTASVGQYELYVDHWGTTAYDSNLAVTPNTWNHVAVTYDGSNVRFYVNGVAGNVVSGVLYDYGVDTFNIGGNTIGGTTTKASFNGLIDDVQLYSRELLPGEVDALYDAGVGPAIAVAPRSGLVTGEDGSTAEFTVVLASPPTAPVSIDLSSSDLSEGELVGATDNVLTLSFDSGNWNVRQIVTVRGVDDAVADGDINYTIVTAAAVGPGSDYDGLDADDILVTNVDNDGSTTMHVGDLDARSTRQGSRWTAFVTITFHDDAENPVAGATVTGAWSGGTSGSISCTTDAVGVCTVKKSKIPGNAGAVTFTVTTASGPLNYESAFNHDVDGDSDGTTINVNKPLHAVVAAVENGPIGDLLSQSLVRPAVDAAISHWAAEGATPDELGMLRKIDVEIGDLNGSLLGLAYSDWIVLDRDAAGYGWSTGSTNSGALDLLKVVTHEIGHLLGYRHSADIHDVMAATLPVDTRRLTGTVPLINQDLKGSVLASPLLFVDPLMNGTHRDLVDHTGMTNDAEGDVAADNSMWLLPLIPADIVPRSGVTLSAVDLRILDDIADEETELLDDELLALIAAAQK